MEQAPQKEKQIMQKFDTAFWVGVVSGVAGWVASFFTPIFPYLASAAILTLMDTATGMKAAVRRGDPLEWHKLARLFEKIVLYSVAIVSAEIIETVFMKGYLTAVPLTYSVALGISFKEFRSNIRNVEEITGASIWEQVRRFASKLINKH